MSVVYRSRSAAHTQAAFRSLRAQLSKDVEVYAGGAGANPNREELELFGVRCPEEMDDLGEALEQQAHGR